MAADRAPIFALHRDLLYSHKPESRASDCPGRMRIVNQDLEIWEARCDACGEEIGIPGAQQKRWLENAGRYG